MTKTTPRGKTPSLIGGTNGRPRRVIAKRRCECYRCHDALLAGQECIEIPKLGEAYATSKRVCAECFEGILQKTTEDLEELKNL